MSVSRTRSGAGIAALIACSLAAHAASASRAPAQSKATHWSLAPRSKPSPPVSPGTPSAIDRFLDARLEAAGLRAVGAADPRSLLRRVRFALTGLPPTPAEIADFLRDTDDGAYARVVDRLLASPTFGERWGRHWLDVARFAESSGGGRSLMFENAWRFRDYVIDAYNADRPFDVFLTEQIAGDLMPFDNDAERNRQLVASGFLELGPTNYELQDKELLRMEVIDEQIDTVGQAFLGLTLGCARCHDHKFDPVTAHDYYALAGIFRSTSVLTSGNVSGWNEEDFAGERTRAWQAWQAKVKNLEARIAALSPKGRARSRSSDGRQIDRSKLAGIVLDDVDAKKRGAWLPSRSTPGYLALGYIHDEDTEKGQKSVRFDLPILHDDTYELRISYTHHENRASNTPVHIDHANGRSTVRINQRRAPNIAGRFVSLGRFELTRASKPRVTFTNESTDGHVIVDAVQILRTRNAPTGRAQLAGPREADADALRRELAKLRAAQAPRPERAMAVRDVARPSDGYFHNRGLVRSKGPRVPRGFLAACGGEKPAIPPGTSGRLQLAQWLTSPSHPLTARVYVNRVWHWLFGTGLVRTVDNFGTKGEAPSHPALLDWLANRFVNDGWSTKRLVREIVLSAAYQRRVATSPEADPANRLLSHFPRRRLDAESLRDAILQISGQLDPKRGGKTIRTMAQYDYAYVFDSRRRSVYVPRFRSRSLPFFRIFDAPDPNRVAGARNVSNVAPQALYLMNSAWVMGQAGHAARAHAAALEAPGALRYVYEITLGRAPREREREIAQRFLGVSPAADDWRALFQALFASLDFRYLR